MSVAGMATGRDFRFGICPGNAATYAARDFGATTIAAIATLGLPVEQGTMFMRNPQLRRPARATGYPYAIYTQIDNDSKGSIPSCSMTLPATLGHLDYFLAGIFQKVTQGLTPGFIKTYVFPQAATRPDFSADAGYYYGLVKENLAGGTTPDETLISAIPTKLTLSCYPEQNEGRLNCGIEWIARDFIPRVAYSGLVEPTQAQLAYYTFTDIVTLTILNAANTCYGFTIELNNNARPIPTGGAGTRGTESFSLPFWSCSITADLLLDDYVRTACNAVDHGAAGTSKAAAYLPFEITWGTASASGHLSFTGSMFPTGWSKKSGDMQEEVRSVTFETSPASTTPETPAGAIQVVMQNNTDRGW